MYNLPRLNQEEIENRNRLIVSNETDQFAVEYREALYTEQKWDRELTAAQILNSLLPNSDLKKVGETTGLSGMT